MSDLKKNITNARSCAHVENFCVCIEDSCALMEDDQKRFY